MMNIEDLTAKDIKEMSYADFVSLIREENRPPGGKKTIREILKNSFVDSASKILEVGCTNGFTSLEVTRTIGCEVIGVDINENSLRNAQERVNRERVSFMKGSAYDLPFEDESFDLVICGNATSFMDKKDKAISEYFRVVRDWGFVALTPMYYIREPSIELMNSVSDIIGTQIDVTRKSGWISLLEESGFEIYYSKDYAFKRKSDFEIEGYVNSFLDKPFLRRLSEEVKLDIGKRWMETMKIFNENLAHVGYSIILLRKRSESEEKELFDVEPKNG